ncbi:MAG: DUF2304 domain-containing protein [Nitrospirae bacterium]|nr:DUF2304 domain-containing protein [Nitrospirota bacterium]
MDLVQIVSIIGSLSIFLIVIELIRRSHLKERYSLIWLAASVVLVVFSLWRPLLHFIARVFHIYYPPSFLFLLAIGFLIVLLLHFSIVISSLSEKNNRLAQEIGMLRERLDAVERRAWEDGGERKETHTGPQTS